MSKYTTEVRFICEEQAGLVNSVGYGDVGEVIDKARPKIFDFPYPIFNETYKPILESKILMHYYTREICEETYGLWKLRLRTRLNDIMPYYNKLYNSELIEYNPFNSDDYTIDKDISVNEDHTDHTVDDNETRRTGDETSTLGGVDKTKTGGTERSVTGGKDTSLSGGTDVSTLGGKDVTTNNRADKTDEWTLYSDTPQGGIAGIEGAEDSPSLGDNGYLTNATHVIGDTTGSTSDSTTDYGRTDTMNYGKTGEVNYGKTGTVEHDRTDTVEYGKTGRVDRNTKDEYDGVRDNTGTKDTATDWLEKVVGYRGIDPNERILKLRETFLNIDNMIIRELRDLFFNIW